MDYDIIIIGSGFGGSVPALRLSEKGYRVAVLEQGRRVSPDDMRDADRSIRKLFWVPRIGFRGFFVQHFFRHVGIVGGVGVGGGSLVYAAVLLKPGDAFFSDRSWANLGIDWKRELKPHFATAATMLGRTVNPDHGKMDDWLEATAEAITENAVIHAMGRNRNATPPATREKTLARDGHRCRTPGCSATHFLELHHVIPRERGGSNKLENLLTLCSRCHRFLHTRDEATSSRPRSSSRTAKGYLW